MNRAGSLASMLAVALARCGGDGGTSPNPRLIFAAIEAGSQHTCGVTTASSGYCWGSNDRGQLGEGTTTTRSRPLLVAGGLTFAAVSLNGHTCALVPTAAAHCWGRNDFGQLGDGTAATRLSPVLVAAPAGVPFAAVSAARSHTCGVTPAGAAYCWGLNGSGQLGNGDATMATQYTPVLVTVPAGVTFAEVSAGDYHTCGLTPARVAYCWGDGTAGQVGDGATQIRLTPVGVTGGLTFAVVSARPGHTRGMTPAGAAHCWGSNDFGQLGDGAMTKRASPVLVVR